MCGRARLSSDYSELKIRFSVPDEVPALNYPPRWNFAPTQTLPIVRFDDKAGHRTAEMMRWGLVPFWAKDIKFGFNMINAKAETIDTAPAFREAFKRRRCLVPFDSYYEWKTLGPKDKQPYAIAMKDHRILGVAGLWETWKSPVGEAVRSFTVATTTANALTAGIHERMPAILPEDAWPMWLGEAAGTPEQLKALLGPYPSGAMAAWPVGRDVGNVKNDRPDLIEPVVE